MKPENTHRMLRQLARFIRQRRGQIIRERLSATRRVTEMNGSKSALQNLTCSSPATTGNMTALVTAPVTSPSVKTIVAKNSGEEIAIVPAAEFVEVFRNLEQVRKEAFAVWWASRNEHMEAVAA